MKLKEYLLDRVFLILFYFILMSFITAVIYLDPTVKVWSANIIYINVVALLLFITYILGSYSSRRKYYQDLNRLIQKKEGDLLYNLPESRNHEQEIIRNLTMQMYKEQNSRVEKLSAERREYAEFIATWVHEIKTPIAVSRLLMEDHQGKEARKLLSSLDEEVDRIDRLVEQVLYYSKTDDFARDYFINEYDLQSMVNEVIKKHAKTFINKNIKLEINEFKLDVTTDKKWLIFILDQLISNSLKYTGRNGVIKIVLEKEEHKKKLIISDNGAGIKPEDVNRVFDKGFTGHNGREFTKSTGMGLYLAKRLARKLGHDITIESIYGNYTRVIVHFSKLGDYYDVTKA